MSAEKTYEAGVPRYVRWLGRVQVLRVAGRTPNLVYKRGEYEHLLSSLRGIDVRVKMEGMTGVPDYVRNRKSLLMTFIVYTICQ